MIKNKTRIALLILVFVAFMLPMQDAYALPHCHGASCNYKDPTAYDCQYNVYTVVARWATASSGTVRMDLRYSGSGQHDLTCAANWTRVTNESPGQVRHLRAELWNDTVNTLLVSFENSTFVYIYTFMYDGHPTRCGKGKQGFVGSGFDAITGFGCG